MASSTTFPISAKASDFRPGELVKLVPKHCSGDVAHPNCRFGKVASIDHVGVTICLGYSVQQVDPADLIKLGSV
jgi:hypothetical protein